VYTYGLQRIDENQIVNNAWTPSFYGYDGFGTVRQLTNSAGSVTDSYEYDAYGNKISSTGTTANNYLYRGEQWDPDLGLYYLRARYYNPVTGRFMSRDPEDGKIKIPATLHKYLYADGDPVNGFDRTGRGDSIIEYLGTVEKISEATESEWYLSRKLVQFDLCVAEILEGFSDTLLSWTRIFEYCGGNL